MKFSAELKLAIQVKRLGMRKLHLTDRGVLLANLGFLYHLMRASESLLILARQMAQDPMLEMFYSDHLEEERGHALWLQRDLVSAGADFATIPREAMLIVGVQYYLLLHVSPASLLGYLAVMECFPTPLDQIKALEELHGTDLLRTARYHAEHDPGHAEELLIFLDGRPAHERPAILESARLACEFMSSALLTLQAKELING
jgi:hypothetical protein